MSKSPSRQHNRDDGPALPRRLRWLQPLLALVGLASLPPALPARTLDTATPIQRVPELRARLLATDAQAAGISAPSQPAPAAAAAPPADELVAQWKKWNDWNNWAKWAKQ